MTNSFPLHNYLNLKKNFMTPALECQGTTSIGQNSDVRGQRTEREGGRRKGEGKKLRRSEDQKLRSWEVGKKCQKSAALEERFT